MRIIEQVDLFDTQTKSWATTSPCGEYRYQLCRIWNKDLPKVLFIMHNPSTADASNDDPTIRRCIGFAKSWGYGGIMVGNLSPFRATDPNDLKGKSFEDLCPKENEIFVQDMVHQCSIIVLAYGNPSTVNVLLPNLDERYHYLKLTKQGNPCHPLYLKKDLKPIQFIKEN